jgi:predicted nucleic acid-binding protein
MSPPSDPPAAVIDASIMVALCAREARGYAAARQQMRQYARGGFVAYAPNVIIAETLFALCHKLQDKRITSEQHARFIRHLRVRMRGILPPPLGEAALIERAEQIRGSYGCSRSADSLYIALAEQLAQTRRTELVTLDTAIPAWAACAAPSVTVRLLTP